MSNFQLYAFYKFIELPDFIELKPQLLCLMKKWNIRGTIILAQEGLNGTICASPSDIEVFWKEFIKESRWADLIPTVTQFDSQAFQKTKVKLRQEIVTMGVLSVKATRPECDSHLNPTEWNKLISDPNTLVIDTRNDYEYEIGTFNNAINPNIDNFRDFPKYVELELSNHKDKPIAMFCTGGVRCEKIYRLFKGFRIQPGISVKRWYHQLFAKCRRQTISMERQMLCI